MKLSIVIINSNPDKLQETLKSLSFQTFSDYESIIAETNIDNQLDVLKTLVAQAQGEYCLFFNAGDRFANDFVLEEAVLNGLDRDIVFGNFILEKEDKKEQLIILPQKLRASDLLINDFPFQAVFVKTSILKEIDFEQKEFPMMIWASIAFLLLIKQKAYKHINFFVCRSTSISTDRKQTMKMAFPLLEKDYVQLNNFENESTSEQYKIWKKLEVSKVFKAIMVLRQKLLDWGIYKIKATYKQKIYYRKTKQADELRKKEVEKLIKEMPSNFLVRSNDKTDLIVSLTSYGKRVTESLPYALYSIFNQIQKPNRIVVFLDNSWNDNNIPSLLKELKRSGLEIEYCEDLRSYKKLIPAIKKFPNNPIITFDDDYYYDERIIKELYDAYQNSDKKSVIGTLGCIVEKKGNQFLPYSHWKDSKYGNKESKYSLYGGNLILYPPNIFDKEILNKEVFMELIPTADDIWFWVHEYRCGVQVELIADAHKFKNVTVNNLDYLVEKDSTALYFQNVFHGKNDESFKKVIEYYQLK